MGVELWWLPSVIVFAVAAASAVVIVAALRRRTKQRALAAQSDAHERARRAAISLVRADDAVQAATEELGFAVAQFGEAAGRDLRDALDASRRDLRDAFALQQRLDDAIPDAADARSRWTEQITALADRAAGRLQEQTGHLDDRRRVERDAPASVDRLRRELAALATRLTAADATISGLAARYAERALAAPQSALQNARTALGQAQRATDAAAARLAADSLDPVGEELSAAELALFQAGRSLGQVDDAAGQLARATAAFAESTAHAQASVAEARELRDRHEEPEARTALDRAIAETEQRLGQLAEPGRRSDPAVELVSLREVAGRLDRARSDARNRQLRLENARAALGGALLTAESQIGVTREFISSNRSRVGAAARTRLAEAERQLELARAEADPVTALDTARRAMTHATDADALARFDTH